MKYLTHRFFIAVAICFCCNIIAQTQVKASLKTAQILERRGEWNGAISIYNDILNKNPKNYQAIRSLKNIYRKTRGFV